MTIFEKLSAPVKVRVLWYNNRLLRLRNKKLSEEIADIKKENKQLQQKLKDYEK